MHIADTLNVHLSFKNKTKNKGIKANRWVSVISPPKREIVEYKLSPLTDRFPIHF